MNCAERVTEHVSGETVVVAWDERIVLVADDEDFVDWQRDWLPENGRF
ncbi:MAG TPA: hypothetical protein VMS92_04885 [Mycobacterium sp.]|nr:hypothetical protein [Mycobacterium sp.]